MHVRKTFALIAAAAALATVSTGCTVSRNQSFDTAYGAGHAPETYRVGGMRTDTDDEMGPKSYVVRDSSLDVAVNAPTVGSGGSHASAASSKSAGGAHTSAPKSSAASHTSSPKGPTAPPAGSYGSAQH